MPIRLLLCGWALFFACSPARAQDDALVARMTNDDVVALSDAEFSDSTIAAAMRANPTRFDITPLALVALKGAGVSEAVIEAMLEAESAKQASERLAAQPDVQTPSTADVAPAAAALPALPASPTSRASPALPASATSPASAASPAPPASPALPESADSPPALAASAASAASTASTASAASTSAAPAASAARAASPGPHVWHALDDARIPLPPSNAQVAFTDGRITDDNAFRTLQGLAGKALAFANPAFGLAGEVAGLFRSDDPTVTSVWALLGPSAEREFSAGAVFEMEFAGIPGVNPDEYRPAVVRLVPTRDNYRLVGAAKTKASNAAVPIDTIIEESAAAKTTKLGRGRYRIELGKQVSPGEFALVLRPIERDRKRRKRNDTNTLGQLLGGSSSDILLTTWDFSIS